MLYQRIGRTVGVGHHSFTFQFNFQIRKRGGERCVVGLTSPGRNTPRTTMVSFLIVDCDHALGFKPPCFHWQNSDDLACEISFHHRAGVGRTGTF